MRLRRTGDMVLVWSIRMREKSYKNNVEYLLFETLGILNRVPKCCWFIGLYRIYLLNLFICVIVRLLHNVCIVFMYQTKKGGLEFTSIIFYDMLGKNKAI